MKRLTLIIGLSMLVVSLSGCQSMRNWWNKGANCGPTCSPSYSTVTTPAIPSYSTVEQIPGT